MGFLDTFKLYIMGALLAALLGLGGWHWIQTKSLEADLATAQADVTTKAARIVVLEADLKRATDTNAKLANAVDAQNAKIDALIASALARGKAADAAIAKAKADAAKWKVKYDDIFGRTAPDGNECTSLKLRLDGYIIERRTEESLP